MNERKRDKEKDDSILGNLDDLCVCSHVPVSRWRGTIATLPRAHLERHLEHNEITHRVTEKENWKLLYTLQ